MYNPHFLSEYDVIGFLGQGSYGKVMKVKSKGTGSILAAKIISLQGLSPNELHRTHEQQRIHSSLRHPNIIPVVSTYLQKDQLIIVMEFCEYGDLNYYVKKKAQQNECFEEKLIMNIFIQIVFGLQYLHENKIVHRDLKPSNIFVDSQGRVKLADFGLSKTLSQSQSESSLGVEALVGTPLYLAPEICANQSPTYKADIWAIGCILYELCALKPPFIANNILALATMIATQDVPHLHNRYSDNINALVRWMLDKSPLNRPNADQILKLSFVSSSASKSNPSTPKKVGQREDTQQHDQFNVYQHESEIEEEQENYSQKLRQNLVKLLGSAETFQQMYNEIKSMKEDYIVIHKKDQSKISNKLLQIYGEEYLEIAKGVAELIDLQKDSQKTSSYLEQM